MYVQTEITTFGKNAKAGMNSNYFKLKSYWRCYIMND